MCRLWGRARVINRGSMVIGDRVRLDGTTVRLELVCFEGAELTIGDGTYINYGTNISATKSVRIGRNCAIGQYSIIMDNDYHAVDDHHRMGEPRPVVIGDDAWLGARVIVLPGATIGDGAVIGANSLVKGNIPPFTLAAGSPARVIRPLRTSDDA
jgi:acetyltransferase-like isoleucine patch superfamily enzyme